MLLGIPSSPTKERETVNPPKFTTEFRDRITRTREHSSEEEDVNNSLCSTSLDSGVDYKLKLAMAKGSIRTHDLQGLMRAAISTIAGEEPGFTRDEFSQLSPEQLKKHYDRQQDKDTQTLDILKEVLRLCETTKSPNRSPIPFFKQEASSPSTEQITSISTDQIKSLEDLVREDAPSMIILLVEDSYVQMKMLLKQTTGVILQSSATPTSSEQFANAGATWMKNGFAIENKGRCSIICAGNGRIALDIVKKVPITAMITDNEMPEMNGLELIASIRNLEIKENRPRMRIALNTAVPALNLDSKSLEHLDLKNDDRYILKAQKGSAGIIEFLGFTQTNSEETASPPTIASFN